MLRSTLTRLNAQERQGQAGQTSQAGAQAAMRLMDGAIKAAGNPTTHRSFEEQVRRFWGGNWVQSSGAPYTTKPGVLDYRAMGSSTHFTPDPERLTSSVLERFTARAWNAGGPYAGLYPNLSQALSARNLGQSTASLGSAQVARDSLAKTGTTLHPERSATPVFGRMKPIATAFAQAQQTLGGDVKPAIGTGGIFSNSSSGGLLSRWRSLLGRTLDATTSQIQAQQAAAPAASPAAPAPNVATASQFSFQQAPQGGSMQNPNPTDRQASVAGQLENILAKDSPLNRQAATMGLQRANQRGLLNSSMAVNAAQDAVTSNALPIASQDAGHYQGMQQANQAHGHKLSEIRASSTANAWGTMAGNMNNTTTNAQAAISAIQNNPDISAANKTTMINQVTAMRDADLQFQQSLYNNLTSLLQNADVFYSF